MTNSLFKTKIAKHIGIVISIMLLIVIIILGVMLATSTESRDKLSKLVLLLQNKTPEEKFQDKLIFPKAQDAYSTGEFDTLQRECAPGLTKCMKYLNGGNAVTYWCAPHCINKRLHLTGIPLKEPMDWNARFA
jgi:hypothetical protein